MTAENTEDREFKALAEEATLKSGIIRRKLRQQVLGGAFVPGDALPSELAMCDQFGVARNTVRKALEELEKEGLICRIQGRGTFVAPRKPDPQKTKKLNIFCLVIPQVDRDLYPQMINGSDEEALNIHHQMMICTTRNDACRQGNIMLQALDKNMAGVALVPLVGKTTPAHHIRQLQTNEIPVVICNRPVPEISAPLVTWDWEEVGRIAAREYLKRGHRRLGYYSNIFQPMAEAHVRGMQAVLAEHGLTMQPEDILYASQTDDSLFWRDNYNKELVQNRLSRPNPPTALLCNDDMEADNVFCAAQEMGLSVPEDLAIIGFGNTMREGLVRKRLSSVTMDSFALGQKAIELLDQMRTEVRSIINDEVFHIPLGFSEGKTV